MKTPIFLFALLAGAGCLSGCSKDDTADNTPIPTRQLTQVFPSEDPAAPLEAPGSRTVVNPDGTISFTPSEQLGSHVWAVVGGAVTASGSETATRTAGNPPTVSVTYTEIPEATEYHFLFVSPAGNGRIADPSTFRNLDISLGKTQQPTPTTFDPVQDVLVSKPVVAAPAADPAQLPSVLFKRMFTFFRMTIDRSLVTQIPAGEQIRSVTLTADEPTAILSGRATVPVTDNPDECVPTFTTTHNSVTADYGTGADFTGDRFDVWLVVNPTTFTGMQIQIRTTTKVITQTLDSFVCDLLPGRINTLDFRWVNNDLVTTSIADYTDYYLDGVTIDGVTYDSASQGAKLVADGATISPAAGGVLFLEAAAQTPVTAPGIVKDLVIVGRYSDSPARLTMNTYWALRNAGGRLLFKNVDLDFTPVSSGYCFNLTSGGSTPGGLRTLLFEDCGLRLVKTLISLYNADSAAGIENTVFRSCKVRYDGVENYTFITTSKADAGLSAFKTLVFDNNLFYAPNNGAEAATALNTCLFYQENQSPAAGSLANLAINASRNTFVNLTGFGSGKTAAYFSVTQIGSVLFSRNILYSERQDKYPAIMAVFYDYNSAGPWPTIDLQRTENKAFNTQGWKLFNTAAGMYYPVDTVYPKNTGTPFSTYDPAAGRFVKEAAYADYGSTLE